MKLTTGALFLYVFAIIIAFTSSATIKADDDDTLNIYIPYQGAVLGASDETLWTHQKFFAFRGIPYAESPSGPLRFQPPKTRLPWYETHDAREFGRACPNLQSLNALNSTQRKEDLEDCLNLSVYSKDLEAKQPVMFFIHGGKFESFSAAAFKPNFLLEKDVVLVVAQYRLGPLGFMATLTNEIPGNVAIMDLQLALDWVQKYIHVFGGDPNQVTIFGQSAGAALTSAVVISPKTLENYFKKSIIQSGSIVASWAINPYPVAQVRRVCKEIGCGECSTVNELNKCMKNADVLDLLTASSKEFFSPVAGDVYGVLPEQPKTLLANFKRTIPTMIGFTKHDGSFLLPENYDAVVQRYGSMDKVTVRQFANQLFLAANDNTGLSNNLLLLMLFKQDLLDTNNHTAAWPAYFDTINNINMKSPVIAYATAMQRHSAPVYIYSFDYVGEYTCFDLFGYTDSYPFLGGVTHADDILYLFNTIPLNKEDTAFAKKMVNLWYTFAADGEPKVVDQPEVLVKPMETESGPYFHINKAVTLSNKILTELRATIDDPDSYKLIKSTKVEKK